MTRAAAWAFGLLLVAAVAGPARAASPAASVDADSLWLTLRQLTGDAPTPLADSTVWITTRYSPTVGYDRAARLMSERCATWGYDVAREYFLPSTLTALSFGPRRGWLAGLQVAQNSLTLASSPDDGRTWHSPAALPWLSSIHAVSAGGGDSVVLAGVTPAGDSGAVAWSADAGETWSTRFTVPGVALRALARRGDELWCAGDLGRIAHSDDGGVSWSLEPAPTSLTLYGLATAGDGPVWAVGEFGTVLRRPSVTGAWETVPLGVNDALRAVTFVDDHHGWIVGTNGLTLHTRDGGATWITAGAGNAFLTCVVARDSLQVWAAGFAGAFRSSSDGGLHWSAGNAGTQGDINALALGGTAGDSLWQGARQRLAVSADNGATWSLRNATLASSWFNVVATRPGTLPAAGSVVLCGHLDSHSESLWTRAPGADDNATGSALLLEAARVLAGPPSPRTLQLVWFGGEEDGLLGSTPRAAAQRAAGDSIALVIDNDQVGRGDAMTLYGNALSAAELDSLAARAAREVPDLLLTTAVDPTYRGSDQAPFWDQGYHAVSFVESGWQDNTHIESTRDSLGAINVDLVARLTRLVVSAAAAWLSPPATAARDVLPPPTPSPIALHWIRVDDARCRLRLDVREPVRLRVSLFRVTGAHAGGSVGEWLAPGSHTLTLPIALPTGGRLADGVYPWTLTAEFPRSGITQLAAGRVVLLR